MFTGITRYALLINHFSFIYSVYWLIAKVATRARYLSKLFIALRKGQRRRQEILCSTLGGRRCLFSSRSASALTFFRRRYVIPGGQLSTPRVCPSVVVYITGSAASVCPPS